MKLNCRRYFLMGKEQVTAQISLYALGRTEYTPPVDDAIATLASFGLDVKVGPLSTVAVGEKETIFRAMQAVFEQASSAGPSVLVVALAAATPEDILGDKYPPYR
jgi:uncharacterized protein YqgV (UPF0045/DUF77 family)